MLRNFYNIILVIMLLDFFLNDYTFFNERRFFKVYISVFKRITLKISHKEKSFIITGNVENITSIIHKHHALNHCLT